MKRFSILVIERDSDRETELCQVDRDPHAIAQGALAKKITVTIKGSKRPRKVPRYLAVRIQENLTARTS